MPCLSTSVLGPVCYIGALDQMLERQIRRYTVSQHWNARNDRDENGQPGRAAAIGAISPPADGR